MITIKTLEQAKKITKSLFEFTKKDKFNLSKFRKQFAQDFGFNELQDAFTKENERKREFICSQYISFFDDPRITIEVAREIQDCHEKAKAYLNEHLQDDSGIKFPIQDEYQLIKRCEEILIIFHEAEEFRMRNFFNVLIKMSFERGRVGYVYPSEGNYGNCELIMAIEVMKLFGKNNTDFIKRMVNYDDSVDYCPETCHYDLFFKIKMVTRSLIWTQSNVGQHIIKTVSNKNKKIRETFEDKKLKAKTVKERNLKTLFSYI